MQDDFGIQQLLYRAKYAIPILIGTRMNLFSAIYLCIRGYIFLCCTEYTDKCQMAVWASWKVKNSILFIRAPMNISGWQNIFIDLWARPEAGSGSGK